MPAGTTDAALGQLAGLTQLETLAVRDSAITNDGLRHLAGWKHLRHLHLNHARIGDQGLIHLTGLVNIKSLNLTGTKTTDMGLSQLEQLHKLRKLYVRATSVTLSGVVNFFTEIQSRPLVDALDAVDAVGRNYASEIISINVAGTEFGDAEMAQLKNVPALKELHLGATQVTDTGLAVVKDLHNLEELFLTKCQISDEGMAHLQGLSNLQVLNLYKTQITAAGLENLMGMKHLRMLYITSLQLDKTVVDRLKKELPQLKVTSYAGEGDNITDVQQPNLPPVSAVRGVDGDGTTVVAAPRMRIATPFALVFRRQIKIPQINAATRWHVEQIRRLLTLAVGIGVVEDPRCVAYRQIGIVTV